MVRKACFFKSHEGFKKTCITAIHMESCSTSEPLLLPPRSAPKASLPSSLDFKWCFSDGVYRGVATPFRSLEGLIFGLLTMASPLRKTNGNSPSNLRSSPNSSMFLSCEARGSTNKNWAVEKEILELEDICLGVLGIASFDSFLCVCVFFSWWVFLVFGVCDLQSFHIDKVLTYTHTINIQPPRQFPRNIAPVFLYIPFQVSTPRKFNTFPEEIFASSKLSKFSRG